MKTKLKISQLFLLSAFCFPLSLFAQGTAFTYQGRLNSGSGLATGTYDVAFTLFATNVTGSAIAGPVTNAATAVTNGLFTTTVDFGPGVFPGANRWLELAVRTNGAASFTLLAPRQALTAVPYAVMAGSASNLLGTLSVAQLPGGVLTNSATGVGLSGIFAGNFGGVFFGDGSGLANLNASQLGSGTVPSARLPGNLAYVNSNQTFSGQNVFAQGIGIGRSNSIFAVDAQADLALMRLTSTNYIYGAVLVLQNQSTNAVKYLGAVNFVDPPGGTPGQVAYIANNPTNANYDVMSFRVGNNVGLSVVADARGFGAPSLVGGYAGNQISTVGSGGDVIAGGGAGGIPNTIYSNSSGVFIGAGALNQVGPNVNNAVIAGGYFNTIQSGADASVIGGGLYNSIQMSAYNSFIGGGYQNIIQTNSLYAVIGGGFYNSIQMSAYNSFIGGGYQNLIQSNSSYASIGGGVYNYIDTGAFESVIAGGNRNTNGSGAHRSFIGGGIYNSILANANNSVIGGGFQNIIQPGAVDAVIGGGYANNIQASAIITTIGGGQNNTIRTNSAASTIGGGYFNTIGSNANPPPSLSANLIAGGYANAINDFTTYGTIGGGRFNLVGGGNGTVPGGADNWALGTNSFAAGNQARATNDGSFVWSDSSGGNFGSTAANQFSVRANGGVRLETAGAGVTVDGQAIFSGTDGSALNNVNAATLNGSPASAFAPASGSANYIQNQSASPQAASLNISGTARVAGLLRSGVETGTAEAPSPAGLVVRRVNSTVSTSNSIVALARTLNSVTNVALVRDGTSAGFQIQYPAAAGNLTIACMGMDNTGTARNFYTNLVSGAAGTMQIYSNAQNLVHFECSFGITFNLGQHLTQVTLSRYATDNFWSGTLISTFNQ